MDDEEEREREKQMGIIQTNERVGETLPPVVEREGFNVGDSLSCRMSWPADAEKDNTSWSRPARLRSNKVVIISD